jgi:energy-coupling factor transporter ATP-binding protein EcfA2
MSRIHWALSNTAYQAPTAVDIYQQRMNQLVESGKHRYSRKWATMFGPGSKINLDGLNLVHEYVLAESHTYSFYENKNVSVLIQSNKRGSRDEDVIIAGQMEVIQSSTTSAAGAMLTIQLKSGLKVPQEVEAEDLLPVGFWRMTPQGADRDVRMISYQPWADIAANYPQASRETLGGLVKVTSADVDGKIALFYGPAGTGKTTFLRTLADAWREWADLEYIIDPEIFLNDPGYITDVMMGDGDSERYRIVLLEDSGELIKEDAKITSGQALSRLLNMTDGLLGAGRKIIVAITTNDDVSHMHPAVVRPGRCMVKAELGLFPVDEATKWLDQYGHVMRCPTPATLAELFHIRGKLVADTHEEPQGSSEGEKTPA